MLSSAVDHRRVRTRLTSSSRSEWKSLNVDDMKTLTVHQRLLATTFRGAGSSATVRRTFVQIRSKSGSSTASTALASMLPAAVVKLCSRPRPRSFLYVLLMIHQYAPISIFSARECVYNADFNCIRHQSAVILADMYSSQCAMWRNLDTVWPKCKDAVLTLCDIDRLVRERYCLRLDIGIDTISVHDHVIAWCCLKFPERFRSAHRICGALFFPLSTRLIIAIVEVSISFITGNLARFLNA